MLGYYISGALIAILLYISSDVLTSVSPTAILLYIFLGTLIPILPYVYIEKIPVIDMIKTAFKADGLPVRAKIAKFIIALVQAVIDNKKGVNKEQVEMSDSKKRSVKDNHIDVKHLTDAANKGDVKSQFTLGDLYFSGKEVKENKDKAVCWFRKAAEKKFAKAQYKLGVCYYFGEGVEEDKSEAVRWFRKAAKQKIAKAQHNLGVCYYFGEGTEENKDEAAYWFSKAAEQKIAKAQYNLGICYTHGKGVDKDAREAVHWFGKAAEQGNVDAQFKLVHAYNNGKGIVANKHIAYTWLIIAKSSGDERAEKLLNKKSWDVLLAPNEKESARQEAEKKFKEIEIQRTKKE